MTYCYSDSSAYLVIEYSKTQGAATRHFTYATT